MNPALVVILLVALLALATVAGLVGRSRAGRVKASGGSETVAVSELVPGESGGTAATLLQFSTEFCSTCGPTGVQLEKLATEFAGVRHVDVDITHRPDLARRFDILQSPTTLVLDGDGAIRARIGGSPRLADLRTRLAGLVAVGARTAGTAAPATTTAPTTREAS
ncbi:TlpA family protein disulfide reductase [Frondihabitans cladoniiphilus]|uniref:Thioredoxin domain-containing protein n=1 Tax=Frondihabitans cladoniiphilus TaxID=715785 RepID=A0ABP8VWA7_9MICO